MLPFRPGANDETVVFRTHEFLCRIPDNSQFSWPPMVAYECHVWILRQRHQVECPRSAADQQTPMHINPMVFFSFTGTGMSNAMDILEREALSTLRQGCFFTMGEAHEVVFVQAAISIILADTPASAVCIGKGHVASLNPCPWCVF